MGGVNVRRWLAGGIAAGVLMWILEGAGSMLYMDRMEAALTAHGLSMEFSAGVLVTSLLVSLIAGLTIVFFYAGVRPRFGPGPWTAVLVAVVLWFGGYFLSIIGYAMLGLFPGGLLTTWAAIGLVEMILASLLGGWIYREREAVPAGA